jgi:hypothetical protein
MAFTIKHRPLVTDGVPNAFDQPGDSIRHSDNRQLGLFASPESTTTDLILGLAVKLPDSCRACGTYVVRIGSGAGPHVAGLACDECEQHRGWMSRTSYDFIRAIATKFGHPDTPIVIRRGNAWAPEAEGRQ